MLQGTWLVAGTALTNTNETEGTMKPKEKTPTEKQLAHVQERGYRSFIKEAEDGSQILLTVFSDSTLVQMAERPDKWSRWSAPTYFEEIYE